MNDESILLFVIYEDENKRENIIKIVVICIS